MAQWVKLTNADNHAASVWVNIDEASHMQRVQEDGGPEYTQVFFPSHLVKVVETPPEIGRVMREQRVAAGRGKEEAQ